MRYSVSVRILVMIGCLATYLRAMHLAVPKLPKHEKQQQQQQTLLKTLSKSAALSHSKTKLLQDGSAITYFVYFYYSPDDAISSFNSTDYNTALSYYNASAVYDTVSNPNNSAPYAKIMTNGNRTLFNQSANL